MNDDLISRKSLIENLNKFAPEHYTALVNDLIMKEPTAFDKEKVIEKINREIEYHHEKSKIASMEIRAYSDGAERAYRLLRSIVEKGGVE